MKILVVGDPYMPVSIFEQALAPLAAAHECSFLQVGGGSEAGAQSPAESAIREYMGTPADVAARLRDSWLERIVLFVSGASAPLVFLLPGLALEAALTEATRYSAFSVTRHCAQKSFATEAEFETFSAKAG